MASNHVPSDQVPLPGQSIYNDTSYQNLFSPVDRYGAPTTWDAQLAQHSSLASNPAPSNQAWNHGSFPQQQQPYNTFSQSYGPQGHGFQTASPYQYGQFGQQGSMSSYAQPSNVDPSLGLDPNALRQQQQSPYQMPMRNATPQTHSGTVTPQALQQNSVPLQNTRPMASPYQIPRTTSDAFAQRSLSNVNVKPVPVPTFDIPKGRKSGGIYVLDQTALGKATKSTALNKLVNLGSEPFHLPTNRTALPLYTSRQSVKELKKAGADNKKLLAKLSSSRPSIAKALKTRAYAGSPSGLKRELSDSDSYTESSDDDSEYTDDEEDEVSPLPTARPEEPHQAVRYDVIKATWCPRNPPPSTERIKEGMRDVWEVLNTIQKRWRADTKAVTEAEEQKKTGELPVLKSRVASQRDLLQSALKAALEHAHPDVLWQLGQIKPFVYLCYQFLANRFHSKDFDGPLSTVIFEVLSRCGTLTTELLEETKVIKALTSMKKHANDKHKALIQQIVDSAVANTKKAKSSPPPRTEPTESKGAKRPAMEPAGRSSTEGPLAKKPKPAEGSTNATKKILTTSTNPKTATASSGTLLQKRPMATSAPIKARVSQVANKPSGIFASLNAASKKPAPATAPIVTKIINQPKPSIAAAKDKKPAATAAKPAFSFAQTMASLLKPKEQEAAPVKSEKQLPPETPEETAKRLRKEARRHLRVTFKPDTALVQIKYFSHDPEEELGHDENFLRHAGDIEGEGRMFKQHKELEFDEDDEDNEREVKLMPWRGEPSQVDFSFVPVASRQDNYAPFGGGQLVPSCPEKEANVRRENATLMVFYADPHDIPSSPREPLEQAHNDAPAVTVTTFGTPPDKVLRRDPQATAPAPVAMPNFSGLEDIFKQFANTATAPMPVAAQPAPVPQTFQMQPAVPVSIPDLSSILSALQGSAPPQPPAPVPAQQLPPPPSVPLPPGMDINTLIALAQAQAGGGLAIPPPPPGMPPFAMWPPFPPQQQDSATYQPQQQPQYNAQSNGSVKRQREELNSNDWGQGKKHKHRGERPHKVLPCKFFQKGTCNKGDNCTYVHDLNM
ncbi:hypothetical protein CC86DRAFT_161319 [Ophiobolus disseminans]|uniref:C3H1-type domain-containing protein n=1 Tax=Ophiobolus disseminans TaxID=1469910 RepID=A0A6A7AAY5_9PLEO|nr:hypothetical protein CC86DRAFT_161319 [Ophiobolus disseminans]